MKDIKRFERLCEQAGGKVVRVNDEIACNIDGVNFDVLSTDIPGGDKGDYGGRIKNKLECWIFSEPSF